MVVLDVDLLLLLFYLQTDDDDGKRIIPLVCLVYWDGGGFTLILNVS